MPSSTLRFRDHCPFTAVRLTAVAVVSWALGAAYTVWLNPEVVFFKRAAALKLDWSRRMAQEHRTKTVFFGGSSCTFAINNGRLLSEHQLPAANLGLGAGMGPRVLTRFAWPEVQRGDTLIMAMEPGLLTNPLDDPMLGVQFSLALGRPELMAAGDDLEPRATAAKAADLLRLRPGGYHAFTLLGKLVSSQPLYRYHLSDFQPSGWQQTAVRRPLASATARELHLSADARRLLGSLRAGCEQKGVRLAYSLPWVYVTAENLAAFQAANRRFLAEVAEYLPVISDPRLGAYPVREHFADTLWHLTEEGARVRTDELARQIKDWQVWSGSELRVQPATQESR